MQVEASRKPLLFAYHLTADEGPIVWPVAVSQAQDEPWRLHAGESLHHAGCWPLRTMVGPLHGRPTGYTPPASVLR